MCSSNWTGVAFACATSPDAESSTAKPLNHRRCRRHWSLNRLELRVEPGTPPEAGGASTVPQAIARQISTQDFCPPERMTHFAWLEQKPRDGRSGPGLVGWWGVIEETTRDSDGWLVSVAVEPRLGNGGTMVHMIEDFYIEVYRFSAGTLRFVKAIVPPKSDWPRKLSHFQNAPCPCGVPGPIRGMGTY